MTRKCADVIKREAKLFLVSYISPFGDLVGNRTQAFHSHFWCSTICGVTVTWVSPCFGYPGTQIASDTGIPVGEPKTLNAITGQSVHEKMRYVDSVSFMNFEYLIGFMKSQRSINLLWCLSRLVEECFGLHTIFHAVLNIDRKRIVSVYVFVGHLKQLGIVNVCAYFALLIFYSYFTEYCTEMYSPTIGFHVLSYFIQLQWLNPFMYK